MISFDSPHRRYNPLSKEWVLVSPHRARRPWLGQMEKTPPQDLPQYNPTCYLCPGNQRAGGRQNPVYTGTFVFDNDFPALLPPSPSTEPVGRSPMLDPAERLFRAENVSGVCRVVCFSPRHDLSLPQLSEPEVVNVVGAWTEQTRVLSEDPDIQYVQVFENKGDTMGCSNPHPHSQIWSTSYIPNEPARELAALRDYTMENGGCLLCDYLAAEQARGERLVATNDHFSAVIPYWAIWPFEILLISRRHFGSLTDMTASETAGLADLLRQVTIRYDNLFNISFPYSMGFHQAPSDGVHRQEAHFHGHFYPPLLRSATVRKFMVGYEMMAMPQRDLTPETAADRLRSVDSIHYTVGYGRND
jgi:UDPglucose--hexose-1-phosphate uridylyltransferase